MICRVHSRIESIIVNAALGSLSISLLVLNKQFQWGNDVCENPNNLNIKEQSSCLIVLTDDREWCWWG